MKKLLLALVLYVFLMTSCANQPALTDDTGINEDSAATNSTVTLPNSAEETTAYETAQTLAGMFYTREELLEIIENEPKLEDIQKLYPDKTVLTWVYGATGKLSSGKSTILEINEYLDSLGCGFAVYFKVLPHDDELDYLDMVQSGIESGEEYDIIFTELSGIGQYGGTTYRECVKRNIFTPLNDYLANTQSGQKLYSPMPERYWDTLRIDGSIYGVDGAFRSLKYGSGFLYDYEMAQKYNYDISKSPLEQLDILHKIKDNENCDVVAMFNDLSTDVSCIKDPSVTFGVYFDAEQKQAKCILDNRDYIDWARTIFELNKEGLVTNLSGGFFKDNCFMFKDTSGVLYPEGFTYETEYLSTGNYHKVIPSFSEPIIFKTGIATGVCSYSKHKDLAFELLALAQTDPYLNNLLTYGIEGQTYIKNGDKVDGMFGADIIRFANRAICYPTNREQPNQAELLISTLNSAELSPIFGIEFTLSGLEEQVNAAYEVLRDFSDKIFYNSGSFDDIVAEYRQELYDAGIQDIIDESNRQYEEWEKSQK